MTFDWKYVNNQNVSSTITIPVVRKANSVICETIKTGVLVHTDTEFHIDTIWYVYDQVKLTDRNSWPDNGDLNQYFTCWTSLFGKLSSGSFFIDHYQQQSCWVIHVISSWIGNCDKAIGHTKPNVSLKPNASWIMDLYIGPCTHIRRDQSQANESSFSWLFKIFLCWEEGFLFCVNIYLGLYLQMVIV